MRMTGSRAYTRPVPVPKMPVGLVELMEGLTRDVLKNNPTDVYEFCADHMLKLLEIRDGPSKKPLSLKQKISRAQEKVKKRAEIRWQTYLNEMQNLNGQGIVNSNEENNNQQAPSPQHIIKPPVHHDLNLNKASEIEISHEQGDNMAAYSNIEIKIADDEGSMIEKATSKYKSDLISLSENQDQLETSSNLSENAGMMLIDGKGQEKNTNNLYQAVDVSEENEKEDKKINNVSNITILGCEDVECVIENGRSHKPDLNNFNMVNSTSETDIHSTNSNNSIMFSEDSDKQENVREIQQNIENYQNEMETVTTVGEDINEHANNVETQELHTIDLTFGNIDHSNNPNDDINVIEECDATEIGKDLGKKCKAIEKHINGSDVPAKESNSNLSHDDTCEGNYESENELAKNIGRTEIVKTSNDLVHVKNPCSTYEQTPQETENTVSNSIIIFNNNDNKSSKNHMEAVNNAENKNPRNEKDYVVVDEVKDEDSSTTIKREKRSNDINIVSTIDELPVDSKKMSDNGFSEKLNIDTEAKEDLCIKSDKLQSDNQAPQHHLEIPDVTSVNSEMNGIIKKDKPDQIFDIKIKTNGQNNESEKILNDIDIFKRNAIVETANVEDLKGKQNSGDESTDNDSNVLDSGTSEPLDDNLCDNSNTNDMDLETAAVTIQKVFRSFLFKSRTSTFEDTNDDNTSMDEDNDKKDDVEFQPSNILGKERIGLSRMDTVLQTVNEEKSLSLSTDDSSTLSSAATTIQAHVRGFLTRNKLHSHKTASTSSQVNSDGLSTTSLEGDIDHNKNKTVLNIHIVPEGNFLSRDESMLTSMDLSLDGSPPSSLNLHPLGYDKNERRKQLKREDAIQSISPPSNNSGKLSEDVDSVKDMLITDGENDLKSAIDNEKSNVQLSQVQPASCDTLTDSTTIETIVETHKELDEEDPEVTSDISFKSGKRTLTKMSSDEMDVVTPFGGNPENVTITDSNNVPKLLHSGELHDVVLPTKVSRSDTTVVSEFKNVLVYFLLWNNA